MNVVPMCCGNVVLRMVEAGLSICTCTDSSNHDVACASGLSYAETVSYARAGLSDTPTSAADASAAGAGAGPVAGFSNPRFHIPLPPITLGVVETDKKPYRRTPYCDQYNPIGTLARQMVVRQAAQECIRLLKIEAESGGVHKAEPYQTKKPQPRAPRRRAVRNNDIDYGEDGECEPDEGWEIETVRSRDKLRKRQERADESNEHRHAV